MYLRKLSWCIATLALASAANAEVYTANLSIIAPGTNVSTAFPGVTLRRLIGPSGATTWSPVSLPAVLATCTYGACPELSPALQIGGQLTNGMEARRCYAGSTIACADGFQVLQATFTNPTDFVEFQYTAIIDPSLLVGYDAAGNEIVTCIITSVNSSTANGCAGGYLVSPGGELFGTIRLTSPTANIKRVITASALGASRTIGLQYNRL